MICAYGFRGVGTKLDKKVGPLDRKRTDGSKRAQPSMCQVDQQWKSSQDHKVYGGDQVGFYIFDTWMIEMGEGKRHCIVSKK